MILDQVGIEYQKNYEFALASVKNYKKSCPDISVYYDNFESIYWLGWCSGILHAHGIPAGINYDHIELDKVVEAFLPHRQLFKNLSCPLSLPTD